jgi:hypothetical protein
MYDQEGCLSPSTVLVVDPEAGRRTLALGEHLSVALERIASALPPGHGHARAALGQLIETRELEAYARGETVFGGFRRGSTVICRLRGPIACEGSPGGRLVVMQAVSSIAEAARALDATGDRLQAVGVELDRKSLDELAAQLGIPAELEPAGDRIASIRLCAIGDMQRPPVTWPADGLRPLASQCGRHQPLRASVRTSSSERSAR